MTLFLQKTNMKNSIIILGLCILAQDIFSQNTGSCELKNSLFLQKTPLFILKNYSKEYKDSLSNPLHYKESGFIKWEFSVAYSQKKYTNACFHPYNSDEIIFTEKEHNFVFNMCLGKLDAFPISPYKSIKDSLYWQFLKNILRNNHKINHELSPAYVLSDSTTLWRTKFGFGITNLCTQKIDTIIHLADNVCLTSICISANKEKIIAIRNHDVYERVNIPSHFYTDIGKTPPIKEIAQTSFSDLQIIRQTFICVIDINTKGIYDIIISE